MNKMAMVNALRSFPQGRQLKSKQINTISSLGKCPEGDDQGAAMAN